MKEITMMPVEYIGKTKQGNQIISSRREWTKQEVEWVNKMLSEGYSVEDISKSIQRPVASTLMKIKRLSKKKGNYNSSHVLEKNKLNQEFLDYLKPKTVIDVYAGEESFYKDYDVISNDKNEKCKTDYHLDAFKFCCGMYAMNKKADLIDLDPFGSAYDCFDLAIKMAQKGLVITLGEMGHKRWKRLDYVGSHYGIERLEDFTLDNLIKHIQAIGRRNKKELIVYQKKEWRNVARVYFTIKPLKITEQWNK